MTDRAANLAAALMAVVLLAILVLPRVVGRSGSHIGAPQSELSTLKSLLDNFHLDCGRYPTTAEGMTALRAAPPSLQKLWRGPYADQKMGTDPWGNPYVYIATGKGFTLTSYGADGKPGGDDLDADIVVTD